MKEICSKCGSRVQREKFGFIPLKICENCGSTTTSIISVFLSCFWRLVPRTKITLAGKSNADLAIALKQHPSYAGMSSEELLENVRKRSNEDGEMHLKISKSVLPLYRKVLEEQVPEVRIL